MNLINGKHFHLLNRVSLLSCCLLGLAGLLYSAGATPQPRADRPSSPPAFTEARLAPSEDLELMQAVEREFIYNPRLPHHLIEVQSENGVIILYGTVDNLLALEGASQVAELVPGVRAVDNRLSLQPLNRTDGEIRLDVVRAMLSHLDRAAPQITVAVRQGVVTLTGTTGSWVERENAADVAKSVAGVQKVQNGISIDRAGHQEN
jgi:osmotically-inducible protein OsmY